MVPGRALARSVPAGPTARTVRPGIPAKAGRYTRSWLARMAAAGVRSANSSSRRSLVRFSMSPRARWRSPQGARLPDSGPGRPVTVRRGLPPLGPGSAPALATTRRRRLQAGGVRQPEPVNRREGSPVATHRLRGRRIRRPALRSSRGLRARPDTESTPPATRQAMVPSRRKPESPRTAIRTDGHAPRMTATILASPSSAPSEASMSGGRSRANGTCPPQVT